MAQLKFSGIQPVEFNGRECAPKLLNTGERLRLGRINWNNEEDAKEADEILASCFPDDEEFVLDFLSTKMTPTDKGILRSYLLEGEKAIAMLERTSDMMAEKAVRDLEAVADKEAK